MKTKLKPCPFCGRPPEVYGEGEFILSIACDPCALVMTVDSPPRAAIRKWNRRAKGKGKK